MKEIKLDFGNGRVEDIKLEELPIGETFWGEVL